MSDKAFLDTAYGLDDSAATLAFYQDWAATCDAEIAANGYATPGRCADALKAAGASLAAPLLDLGCGTGLSGVAFKNIGFQLINGSDFSSQILAAAMTRDGVYRSLTIGDLNNPIPAEPGEYHNVAAVGVFSPGHAPASMVSDVMDLLPVGGCFVFSLNDHALEDASYNEVIRVLVVDGVAEVMSREYGDYFLGRGLEADICALRRL